MLEGSNYYNVVDVLHDTGQLVKQSSTHTQMDMCFYLTNLVPNINGNKTSFFIIYFVI